MERGNVLVIGNSGVGKSTLINAVLGGEVAKTGFGSAGTTKELEIYESKEVPFRIIDTVGFEPSWIKQRKAINAVKKWSKESIKDGEENKKINMIWFCIEGTSSKLFPETIKNLSRATSIWKSVPVIVVITKSYSVPERKQNIEMVESVFNQQKRHGKNLKEILPVVASTFTLNDNAFAAPEGIIELIDATNEHMPEGIKASKSDVYNFKLKRKKALSQSVVGLSTTSAITVAAVPIPFSDALVLGPIELAQVRAIAQIYEINKTEESKKFIDSIIEVGTVSLAAKAAISSLKAVPGINIAASVLNAIIAGAIVATIGEGSIFVFEKIYTGEKSFEDVEWMKKVMEKQLSSDFINNISDVIEKVSQNGSTKDIQNVINSLLPLIFKDKVKNPSIKKATRN